MSKADVLLEVKNMRKYFLTRKGFSRSRGYVKAVDDVDLLIREGETLGLVGESGCGKSTLGRSILRLHSITDGEIYYRGDAIHEYSQKRFKRYRQKMQIIFQDPYASLNPRMTIFESVRAPLDAFSLGNAAEKKERIKEMLDNVGLSSEHIYKYPHEMSGGERQRVVIARAMILYPEFVVCDEPVSALDVSIRSQILNLMRKMQRKYNLSYLFISHDLSVVRYICDTTYVMYLGKFVEQASTEELFNHPLHPYTRALLSAIPVPDVNVRKRRIILEGDVPSPLNPPNGCRFHNRCAYSKHQCSEIDPPLVAINDEHKVACHRAKELVSI